MPTEKPKSAPDARIEELVAPKLVARWLSVSRSQVDRIAAASGWGRVYLSDARRGSVRYRLSDVQKFIQDRTIGGSS